MKKCKRCGESYPNEAFKTYGTARRLTDNCDLCRAIIDEENGVKRANRKESAKDIEARKLTVDQFRKLDGSDDLKKHFRDTTLRLTEKLL